MSVSRAQPDICFSSETTASFQQRKTTRIHLKANPRTAAWCPLLRPLLLISSCGSTVSGRWNYPLISSAAKTSEQAQRKCTTSSFRLRSVTAQSHCRTALPGVAVAIPLRAKRANKRGASACIRSPERLKHEKIRMRRRRLLDLSVEIRNAPDQTSDQLSARLSPPRSWPRSLPDPNRWNRAGFRPGGARYS